MKDNFNINIEDYDYELPEERIAQYPLINRDDSKLLVYKDLSVSEDRFRNIADYLPPGALLVFNNTRVINARILFRKPTGALIEILCIEPVIPREYQQSFASSGQVEWKCIIGNLKKWKKGPLSTSFIYAGKKYVLSAEKTENEGEAWRIRFRWSSDEINFGQVIEGAGHIPLPPYIRREDEKEDYIRYQTIYSRIEGSVAAPTAGLHFTKEVLGKIRNKAIDAAEITLHVGAGTFQPVKKERIREHEMHCEHYFISAETIKKLIKSNNNIIAVGTTSVRTLESLYWLGARILEQRKSGEDLYTDQWEYLSRGTAIPAEESLAALLEYMNKRNMGTLHASTRLFIIPGYRFRITGGMITNFHQPRSTLLLLVSAWTGEKWKEIYKYAISNSFRFLSYGDSSLLLR